jgi:hypothetical protein
MRAHGIMPGPVIAEGESSSSPLTLAGAVARSAGEGKP